MIVRLTHPQIVSVRAHIPLLHSAEMQLHRTRANRTQSDIELPAIAWRQIVDHLKAKGFGPLGGRRGYPPSLYRAIAKIQDAVNTMETHPAMRRGGAIGIYSELLPAWRGSRPGSDLGLSPYPNGREFVVLTPLHHYDRGREFTTWIAKQPSDVPHGVTHEEGFHLLFCAGVVGAGVPHLDGS